MSRITTKKCKCGGELYGDENGPLAGTCICKVESESNQAITEFLRRCEEKAFDANVDYANTELVIEIDTMKQIAKEMREG